ncbi:FliH/SctL family protein [Mobiluncus mulieris]|uniref:FliH/SctL family protein n=1 Tax=Mobiluncus mulieris TaxID=2052 RepID=UPI0021E2FEE3|nr:FliH/SctL family protein [Mobiluncus mulieris]MCV0011027.1 flagellar assembly protein FliH [Mobiluncus mulieris]
MWLDQDLLEVKENQRRGGVAAKTVLPAVNNSPAANFQLASATNQNKSNDKSSQAFGYAKGFSAGWAAGQKRATREAEAERAVISEDARLAEEARTEAYVDAMDEIQAMADAIESRDALVVDEMKSALMEAALTLAEALLGAELSDRETGAKSALKRALSMNDPKEIVKVNMNPQDVETLNSLGVECPVKLVPDAELDPGDAVAYMPEGLLDARLSSAVERAREALATVQAAEE